MSDTRNYKENINAREGGTTNDSNHHPPPPNSFNTSASTITTASKPTKTNYAKNEQVCKDWLIKNKKKCSHKQENINQSTCFHKHVLANKKKKTMKGREAHKDSRCYDI